MRSVTAEEVQQRERGFADLPNAIVTAFVAIVGIAIILGVWSVVVRADAMQEPRLVTAAQARNQLVRARAATACDTNAMQAVTNAGSKTWNPHAAEHVTAATNGNDLVLEDAAGGVASRMGMRLLTECLPGGTVDYTQ